MAKAFASGELTSGDSTLRVNESRSSISSAFGSDRVPAHIELPANSAKQTGEEQEVSTNRSLMRVVSALFVME